MDKVSEENKVYSPAIAKEEGDIVLSVRNVSKKFCRNLRRSMAYGIWDLSKNLVGVKPDSSELRKDEFWALKDISFDLRKGQVLGLIGVNGSGKTTLLRLLAGIFPPDQGEISIKGRVGALIAVGAGFHPHMTGRENIYLNGTILGMSKEELNSKFESIVDFAEIGEFLDAPVSTYSSGMHVRLGFAIAVHIEPDVLLIDEVLAVGDMGFVLKCINAIDEIMRKAAVVFVSHSMPSVSRICSDVIVMNKGRMVFKGKDVHKGIDFYNSQFEGAKNLILGSGRAVVHDVKIYSDKSETKSDDFTTIKYLDDFFIEVSFSLEQEIKKAKMNFGFVTRELQNVGQCWSHLCNFEIINKASVMTLRIKIPRLQLNPGLYHVVLVITDENIGEYLTFHTAAKEFQVTGPFVSAYSIQYQGEWEYI